MRILLTNDDGIRAPGIAALYEAAADPNNRFGGPLAELVWPIAPLTVQSATSHGVTFDQPLMTTHEQLSVTDPSGEGIVGIAVDGRPADCVKLALCSLWPERFGQGSRPDLVLSGINAGANCGINVIYSGTVAAAIEAAFLGIPAIALSLHLGRGRAKFDNAAVHARRALEHIVNAGIPDHHTCLNVNIPRCEEAVANTPEAQAQSNRERAAAGLPGPPPTTGQDDSAQDAIDDPTAPLPITVCPMNTHALYDKYERNTSPSGDAYYWPAGSGLNFREADPGTDVEHLFKRHITITPLSFDLTHDARLEDWQKRLESDHSNSM